MAVIIAAGERSIYSPAHYKILQLLKSDPIVIIDMLFTWELAKAKEIAVAQNFFRPDHKVIIDGIGWVNLGNKSYFDWSELDRMSDCCQPEKIDYLVTHVTVGCPKQCEYCFSQDFRFHQYPEVNRNKVFLTDQNLLALKDVEAMLYRLGEERVNAKVVYYELIAGLDKDYLTSRNAVALYKNRFKSVKFSWDNSYAADAKKVCIALGLLEGAGYRLRDLKVFMLCNHQITFAENLRKLRYLWERGVQVADCWFREDYYWPDAERKLFRFLCRRMNMLIRADCQDLELFISYGGNDGKRYRLDSEFKRLFVQSHR